MGNKQTKNQIDNPLSPMEYTLIILYLTNWIMNIYILEQSPDILEKLQISPANIKTLTRSCDTGNKSTF